MSDKEPLQIEAPDCYLKICGLREPADVYHCISEGIDAVGMLVSKHRLPESHADILSWEDARSLAQITLGTQTKATLLCHTQQPNDLASGLEFIEPQAVQIQVPYNTALIQTVKRTNKSILVTQTIKMAAHWNIDDAISNMSDAVEDENIAFFLLDNPRGGSGGTIDWSLAAKIRDYYSTKKFILAGGINATNFEKARSIVEPFGFDVMTGARINRGNLDNDEISRLSRLAAKS
jgi:phosphoribosylanthranilate isomerase